MITTKAQNWLFGLLTLVAITGFAWPLFLPASAPLDAGYLAVAGVLVLSVAAIWIFDRSQKGANYLALLGTMAALAAATRIATSGVAGFELVFLFVIIGGAAIGPAFGFQLGALTIVLSSLFFGGFGPWTPFQLFAVGWVGLGAGLIVKLAKSVRAKVLLLAAYSVFASYIFGLVMNLWFWPFAVGPQSSISYQPGAPLEQNLASFLLYSLTSSTLTWDSVRAIVLAVVILAIGKSALAVLARTKL
ncbi:MAG: ECF transporter S component [Actinobacteria bacterium]|nr:ECF transporter S component [Actinomycetota bacterium]